MPVVEKVKCWRKTYPVFKNIHIHVNRALASLTRSKHQQPHTRIYFGPVVKPDANYRGGTAFIFMANL